MNRAVDREWLASRLPHRGAMSLVEEIVAWDAERLHARTRTHRSPSNPLRRDGVLAIACAIEYAAQAAAAHGALLAPDAPASHAGFLVSVRGADFRASRLDDIEDALDIEVERAGEGAGGVLYSFRVGAAGRLVAQGRVTIVLDAAVVVAP